MVLCHCALTDSTHRADNAFLDSKIEHAGSVAASLVSEGNRLHVAAPAS